MDILVLIVAGIVGFCVGCMVIQWHERHEARANDRMRRIDEIDRKLIELDSEIYGLRFEFNLHLANTDSGNE